MRPLAGLVAGLVLGLVQLGAAPVLFGDPRAAPLIPLAAIAGWSAARGFGEVAPCLLGAALVLGVASEDQAGWFVARHGPGSRAARRLRRRLPAAQASAGAGRRDARRGKPTPPCCTPPRDASSCSACRVSLRSRSYYGRARSQPPVRCSRGRCDRAHQGRGCSRERRAPVDAATRRRRGAGGALGAARAHAPG